MRILGADEICYTLLFTNLARGGDSRADDRRGVRREVWQSGRLRGLLLPSASNDLGTTLDPIDIDTNMRAGQEYCVGQVKWIATACGG